ncbi:LysR family transcriptional regulator [Xanthobacter autotrophicus]|uniref:LysR family transcriptional regulator n=1 Tax=Xanthobacter autotrophicus TaxID=280 RepID=UPI00372699EB
MDIDLKAAIQFAHLARVRSFSRCAAELGVSQPWLSARIARLEERLGCKLFHRTTRQMELTAEGERLLAVAEVLANSAAAFEMVARDLRGHAGGRLKIGSPPYASHINQRVQLIEHFAAATRAGVELDIGWSRNLIDRLRRGELDAAFLVEPLDGRGLELLPFCIMQLVIVVKASDRLTTLPAVRPADLAGRGVGVFTRTLNPKLFDELFTPLATAGARIIELPELNFRALMSDQAAEPSVLASMGASPAALGRTGNGLSVMPLLGVPKVKLTLARRKGTNSAACQRFWKMAQTYCNQEEKG